MEERVMEDTCWLDIFIIIIIILRSWLITELGLT